MCAKKKELTVEEKLRALYQLQTIDSQIDKIRTIRGELPLEVQDLEDELEGLTIRLTKVQEEVKALEDGISEKKNVIKDSQALIKKYEAQQGKVRNNREYDSLTKEIEYQNLEIQLAEKRIKEHKAQIANKSDLLTSATDALADRQADLDGKKAELDEIVAETQSQEEMLLKKSKDAMNKVDERLLKAYDRIRGASKNGLAVVPIDREASAGSFIKIPPQKQMEIAQRKKIIVDEHSGRILVDKQLAVEETENVQKMIDKLLKKK
jgi:predicted  nucleic acid-binding Zn-ribbon protein